MENKVPTTLFGARKVAGSATSTQSNGMKLCCPVRSGQTESLFRHKTKITKSRSLSSDKRMLLSKLHSAPLNQMLWADVNLKDYK